MSTKTNEQLRHAKWVLKRRLKRLEVEELFLDEQLEDLRIRVSEPGLTLNPSSVQVAELKRDIAAAELAKAEINIKRAKTQKEIDGIERELRARKTTDFLSLSSILMGAYLNFDRRDPEFKRPGTFKVPTSCVLDDAIAYSGNPVAINVLNDPAGTDLKRYFDPQDKNSGSGSDCIDGR